MTVLTAEPVTVVETDKATEHDKPCATRYLRRTGGYRPCPLVATWRAFVNCPAGHERTLYLCDVHVETDGACLPCRPARDRVWTVIAEPLR